MGKLEKQLEEARFSGELNFNKCGLKQIPDPVCAFQLLLLRLLCDVDVGDRYSEFDRFTHYMNRITHSCVSFGQTTCRT